jgi:hypothetical protein
MIGRSDGQEMECVRRSKVLRSFERRAPIMRSANQQTPSSTDHPIV